MGTTDRLKQSTERLAPAILFLFGLALLAVGLVLVFLRAGPGPSTVVTTGVAPHTSVVTTPGKTALGSDVVDSFFLGSAVVLILTGLFYPRISKIGLPGGGSIELTPEAQAKVAQAVAAEVSDPTKVAAAYHATTTALKGQYWGTPLEPPDDAISAAVEAATKDLVAGSP